jgi:hypothetical protein
VTCGPALVVQCSLLEAPESLLFGCDCSEVCYFKGWDPFYLSVVVCRLIPLWLENTADLKSFFLVFVFVTSARFATQDLAPARRVLYHSAAPPDQFQVL